MLKRVLVAAAMIVASPALVSAQDLFLSFDSNSVQTTAVLPAGSVSGTAFIFSSPTFGFDAADISITPSDTSVVSVSGGTAFNDVILGNDRFDSTVITTNADDANVLPGNGRLFSVNVTGNGVNPLLFPTGLDGGFIDGVGVRLAEVNFEVLGPGDTTISLALGEQGVLALPDTVLDPAFGSVSLTVEAAEVIPEPSSIALLLLGSVGMVARRKRS